MNILDTILQPIARRVAAILESADEQNRKSALQRLGDYFEGNQAKPLKTRTGQYDDNLILNQVGLIVDRSISMLFGPGVDISLENEQNQEYIDAVFEVNRKDLLLHTLGLYGSTYGTAFVKIVPDGITDPYTMQPWPRLAVLNPELVTVEANPADIETVQAYVIEWSEGDDKWREITHIARDEAGTALDTWTVDYLKSLKGGPYILDHTVDWPYAFPPILHIKNLPSLNSAYGLSDVEQVLTPQDKLNFINSNIGKIIRYHAHPKTVGIGLTASQVTKVNIGADDMVTISNPEAKVANLEMQSDLASSRAFSQDIQREIASIARTVDTTSLADKVGQLTNFGLRVLYNDALAKNDTKRLLYGEGLIELTRRLLELDGKQVEKATLNWGDPLVSNEVELAAQVRDDMAAGIISKETAYELRGYDEYRDFEEEQERLAAQQTEGDNVGAAILRAFEQGKT